MSRSSRSCGRKSIHRPATVRGESSRQVCQAVCRPNARETPGLDPRLRSPLRLPTREHALARAYTTTSAPPDIPRHSPRTPMRLEAPWPASLAASTGCSHPYDGRSTERGTAIQGGCTSWANWVRASRCDDDQPTRCARPRRVAPNVDASRRLRIGDRACPSTPGCRGRVPHVRRRSADLRGGLGSALWPRPCDRCAWFTDRVATRGRFAHVRLADEFPWGASCTQAPAEPSGSPHDGERGLASVAWFARSADPDSAPNGPAIERDFRVAAEAVESAFERILDRLGTRRHRGGERPVRR